MKSHLFVVLLAIFPTLIFAGNYDKSLLDQVVPVEPTASSLGKYGVYPVNYSSGLPSISIPLYDIKSGDLSQKIELSYHGGGIRVSEEATWVGLGWDLNLGGAVSRTVNGFPDEAESTIVPTETALRDSLSKITNLNNIDYFDRLYSAEYPAYSFKPDLYHYNFGNYSGTFVLSSDNKPISIAHNALDGTITTSNMRLISPDGTKYDFTGTDITTLHGILAKQPPFTSTYGISSILSANNTDTIRYEYQPDGVFINNLSSSSQGYSITQITCVVGSGGAPSPCQNSTTKAYIPETKTTMYSQFVSSSKPKYIYFNEGRITFNLSARSDVDPGYSNRINKLDNIVIERKSGASYVFEKRYQFYYSYFNPSSSDFNYLRLCLDSVVELNNGGDKLIASFDYYGGKTLPEKKSNSVDYWGFHNGKNNSSAIPLTIYKGDIFGGADKTPNPDFAQKGTIKTITYPTKGKTEFIWEGNRVNSENPVYNTVISTPVNLSSYSSPTFLCTIPVILEESPGFVTQYLHSYVAQDIILNLNLAKIVPDNLTHNKYDVGWIAINGTKIMTLGSGQTPLQLTYSLQANQDYSIVIYTNCSNVTGSVSFQYNSYNPSIDKNNYPFAGLRIEEVRDYGIANDTLLIKSYTYLDAIGHSSGYLTNSRMLTYNKFSHFVSAQEVATVSDTYLFYATLKSGLEANNFSYEYVQEYNKATGKSNGYTNYKFNKETDIFINSDVSVINQSHLRGRLVNQTDYQIINGLSQKVKDVTNYYSLDNRINRAKKGLSIQRTTDYTNISGLAYFVNIGVEIFSASELFIPRNYEYKSDWVKLDSTITKEYDLNLNCVETKTVNTYGNEKHLQPTEVKSYGYNGLKITNWVYPSDQTSAIATEMVSRNMLTYPLDIKEYYQRNGTPKRLTDGNYLTYEKDNNNHVLLTKVSEYLTDGTLSDEYTYTYNNRSRLIETTGKDGVKSALCWDSNNYNPIVIGKNVSYSTLSAALQSVNGNLSSLYTYPTLLQAQISTYTYKPLIGIATKTDPRQVTTYFDYDGYGRLLDIKDHQNKLINQFQYHYLNQDRH